LRFRVSSRIIRIPNQVSGIEIKKNVGADENAIIKLKPFSKIKSL
jgi:hypothetical protein